MANKCPTCGSELLSASIDEEKLEVAGVVFTANLPGERCLDCGEVLVGQEALERFELAVAAELARMGQRTGTALRFMRKALGYGSGELAALLMVAPETLSRWETGERVPDANAFALVGTMAADRLSSDRERTVGMLRAMAAPAKLPGVPFRIVLN